MRTRITALALALFVSLFVWSARPATAEAQDFQLHFEGGAVAGLVAGAVVGVAVEGFVLGLGIADFVSYGIDSPWDDGWAIVDIVVGSLCLVPGLAFLATGASNAAQGSDGGPLVGAGLAYTAWGSHMLAHGIWSLVNNDRPPPVTLSASAQGVGLNVAGTF